MVDRIIRGKGGKPKGLPPKPDTLAKEAEVLKLRRGGMTWDMIAQRVGYAAPSGARDAFLRATARIVRDDVEAIRELETERLDLAQTAIWSKVMGGDISAITALLRIMERRAKLLGLDQPVRIQAEVVNYDATTISEHLREIASSIAHRNEASQLAIRPSESDPDTA